jgi:hypothetical protein
MTVDDDDDDEEEEEEQDLGEFGAGSGNAFFMTSQPSSSPYSPLTLFKPSYNFLSPL